MGKMKKDSESPTMNMSLISRFHYKLICSSLICLIFIIIEVVGGVLSNSLAIATNALHLFTDLLTFIISLIAIWVAGLPTSQRMSFGWHRAEILGSFVSILISSLGSWSTWLGSG